MPIAWRSGFEHRSGRSFANLYLVDWALALALEGDKSAQKLRDQLAGEIFDSMNEDHTFGLFDVPMSSAFAILSLAALGRLDRTLLLARLRLMDFMEPDGTFPPGTPFYCAETGAEGGPHEISPFFDSHKAISTSAAALALRAESSPPPTKSPNRQVGRGGSLTPGTDAGITLSTCGGLPTHLTPTTGRCGCSAAYPTGGLPPAIRQPSRTRMDR